MLANEGDIYMNEDRQQPNKNDILAIDLLDLLATFLRRWKLWLSVMAIFSVLFGAVSFYSYYKENVSRHSEDTVDSIKLGLTSQQISKVDQLYNRYQSYKTLFANNQYYFDHSILMQINPNTVSEKKGRL